MAELTHPRHPFLVVAAVAPTAYVRRRRLCRVPANGRELCPEQIVYEREDGGRHPAHHIIQGGEIFADHRHGPQGIGRFQGLAAGCRLRQERGFV